MATIESVRASIDANIKTNGNQEITGKVLNSVLHDVVDLSFNDKGKYPSVTAGFANNLVGRGEAVDATINFRASGGKSIEDGAARVKELKGNSVVWNQMSTPRGKENVYGLTFAPNGSAVTVKGTLVTELSWDQVSITEVVHFKRDGRKYLIDLVGRGLKPFGIMGYGTNNQQGFIWSANAAGEWEAAIGIHITLGESIDMEANVLVVDLTQMFGEGNEPTTLEEFYSRIPQNVDLYAYNEGEVIHTNADGIKSVGFNAWDGVMYEGFVNDANGDLGSVGKNTGFIRILPNTDYYIKTSAQVGQWGAWYDEQKNYISGFTGYNKVHKSPSNAAFMRCTCMYIGVANADGFCINLAHSGYRNGEYQPYVQFIRDIDSRIREAFPNGMRSAGNASDKVYNKNGKGIIEKRIGKVKINDLTWSLYNIGTYGIKCFTATRPTNTFAYINASTYHGILSETFINKTWNEVYDAASESAVGLSISATKNEFRIVAPNCNDVETFLASYGESYIIYELAEPEILEFDEPFNLDYEVWDFGTEQMLSTEPSAPIKASIVYGFNAVDSVRNAQLEIAELKTQIAQMQTIMASLTAQPEMIKE